MRLLTPDLFEQLIADRFEAMGLGVQRIGNTNQRDGGIDIIAWPKENTPFGFLIAAQVKHRRESRIGPGTIRDMAGVLLSKPFDIGLIVTNTSFTRDARYAASCASRIIRLRDFKDVAAWIRSDFQDGDAVNDLPREILLGPGLRVSLPIR